MTGLENVPYVQAVQSVNDLNSLNDLDMPAGKMELNGKKVMVLGLARTGIETVRFLIGRGAQVLVSDCKSEKELEMEMQALAPLPVRFLLGGEEISWLEGVD